MHYNAEAKPSNTYGDIGVSPSPSKQLMQPRRRLHPLFVKQRNISFSYPFGSFHAP